MDKRLVRIFELVYLLNSKGEQLILGSSYLQMDVSDRNNRCNPISDPIYFGESWEDEFDERVNELLEILEEKWRTINE